MSADIQQFVKHHEIERISIISPHLDDAAYSLAEFIGRKPVKSMNVLTVFTTPRVDGDSTFARAMGFADANEEFEARRKEDVAAMQMLGVPFTHTDAKSDQFSIKDADDIVAQFLTHKGDKHQLVLLPAGSGRPLNWLQSKWCWLTRTPVGCRAHGDHENVRDLFRQALAGSNAIIAYYADIPYAWAESNRDISTKLEKLTSQKLLTCHVKPDIDQKLNVVRSYISQISGGFGAKPYYQRRTASRTETIFIPKV